MAGNSKRGAIHLRIIEVMKRFPDGVSGGQIRQELEKAGLRPEDQTHLDRRKRDLKTWFRIRSIQIDQHLIDLLFDPAEEGIARTLLRLAPYGKHGRIGTILPKVSQQSPEEIVGATRLRLDFFMSKFRRPGPVNYNRVVPRFTRR